MDGETDSGEKISDAGNLKRYEEESSSSSDEDSDGEFNIS